MKTIRALAPTLALMLLCACVPALAEEEELLTCGDYEYRLSDDSGAVLTGYIGPEGEVVIPNELDGHPVTGVQGNPFFKPEEYRILNCTFKVARDHPSLATIGGVLFCKTDRRLVCYPPSAQGPYEIPQGIESIGEMAFAFCSGLTDISIPDGVTSIGEGAFVSCNGLTSVTIPDGVTAIGDWAFESCGSLTDVSIPDSVTAIGNGAFSVCVRLKTIAVSPGNPVYADMDGVLYTKALDSLVACPAGKEESAYRIPDGVTSIGDFAFTYCGGLTSVTIPDSVTSIGVGAFYGCTSLTSVTIPDSVTSIGQIAFVKCGEGFTVTCGEGSVAAAWCERNGVAFVYPQPDYTEAPEDWLY